MKDKTTTIDNIVSEIKDGMTIGIGGWGGRRKPMALVRALLRTDVKNLTVISYGGPDIGMLCSAKKVKKLIFGFVSLDAIALDSHFRLGRQSGEIQCVDYDEGMMQWGLRAAAMRLPFLPTRAGIATDVLALNPDVKTVISPYEDGEEFVAMPALNLDIALIHTNVSDRRGNSQIHGPDPFFDDLYARAADRTFLTCEKIVETSDLGGKGGAHRNYFERNLVTGVAEAPYGAHPTSCGPAYGIDIPHLKAYSGATGAEEWAQYNVDYINLSDHDAYVKAVGGGDAISMLPLPVF